MKNYIPKIIAGLVALVFSTGCGEIVQIAGRPKRPGEENAPSFKTDFPKLELGQMPDGEHEKAHWYFRKGKLEGNVKDYEKGLGILAQELREFYSNPYKGFTNSCDSADMFMGVFEDSLNLYKKSGNIARQSYALHHLDWLSWNKHKLDLHRVGVGTNEIERLEREGNLTCFVKGKYGIKEESMEHPNLGSQGDAHRELINDLWTGRNTGKNWDREDPFGISASSKKYAFQNKMEEAARGAAHNMFYQDNPLFVGDPLTGKSSPVFGKPKVIYDRRIAGN